MGKTVAGKGKKYLRRKKRDNFQKGGSSFKLSRSIFQSPVLLFPFIGGQYIVLVKLWRKSGL